MSISWAFCAMVPYLSFLKTLASGIRFHFIFKKGAYLSDESPIILLCVTFLEYASLFFPARGVGRGKV
jgi:hypothetical protein